MDSKTKKLALIGAAVVVVGAGVTMALQKAAPSAWAASSNPVRSNARRTA